ncbi:uncharacterized protein LOC134848110 isoform X2 [Symsagittifera roscoffensis]
MVECSFQTSGHVTSLPADPQIGAKGGAQVQPTDYSGGLLNVKDAGQLYVRRHSWDSRKTAQQKTMPNIKICVSQVGPSRESSKTGSKQSVVDVIVPGDSPRNSMSAGGASGSNSGGAGGGSGNQACPSSSSRRDSRRVSNVSNYFESACRNKKSMRRRRKSTSTTRALSSVDLSCCGCSGGGHGGGDQGSINSFGELNSPSSSPQQGDKNQLVNGPNARKISMFEPGHVGKTLSGFLSPFRCSSGTNNTLAAAHQFCSLQKLPSGSSSQCCSACSSRRSSFDPPSPELGFVEVEALWSRESMKLTVNVLNAWDVDAPFQGKLLPNDNFVFKLSLRSAKPVQQQKQESTPFTNIKDPSFNQKFTFYAITEDMLSNSSIKLKFMAKSNALRRKKVLSHCDLKMDSLQDNKVTKFWLALEEQTVMKTIGTLNFSLRFTRDGTLQLSNMSAQDLPKKVLKTSTGTYLTIIFEDKEKTKTLATGGPMVHKTSIVLNSASPQFIENYNFRFSPRNVHDCTLEISLHQKCKLRSDLLVGQVRLGLNSTEVSEFEHWTSVISNPGVTQEQTHFLMEPDVT